MAFQEFSGNFQYHPPVAPIVPESDNTAAKIISAGTGSILEGLTRMAVARRAQDVAQQKMMLDAQLDSRKLDIMENQNADDFEVHKMLYGSYQDTAEARKFAAKSTLLNTMMRNKQSAEDLASRNEIIMRARDDAKELGLLDPKLQLDPMKFAASLTHFTDHWRDAPLTTGIKDQIGRWQNIADQHKITVNYGATKDSLTGSYSGGRATPVVAWKVMRDLQNPDTAESTWAALRAAGHVTDDMVEDGTAQDKRPRFLGIPIGAPPPRKTKKVEKIDRQLEGLLNSGADFTPQESRVPAISPRGKNQSVEDMSNDINNSAPLPEDDPNAGVPAGSLSPSDAPNDPVSQGLPPDATTAAQPTKADQFLEMARKAIARGAPVPQVAARLREMEIDPTSLFS